MVNACRLLYSEIKFTMTDIADLLVNYSVKDLQQYASIMGISISTKERASKITTVQHIVQHLETLKESPERVISIDVGTKHLAFTVLSRDHAILDWSVHDFGFDSFDICKYTTAIYEFVQLRLKRWMDGHFAVLSEDQYVQGTQTPHHIIEVNMVAAQLHAFLRPFAQTIRPVMVSQTFGMSGLPYRTKKAKAVAIVSDLVESKAVACSDESRRTWETAIKKDDLSDCLLQALAYYEWIAERHQFLALHRSE